jgi:long-chain acyl-CoA synthetase
VLRTDLIAPIPELWRRHAAERGNKCAYRDAQTSVTYAALLERTGKLAGHLADHDIGTNDTVAIFLPNSVPWVESAFAIARAGAVSVPISYDSTEAEIGYRLADADCKAAFTTAERGDLLARLKTSTLNLKTLIVTDRGSCAVAALRTRTWWHRRRNRSRATLLRCTRPRLFCTPLARPAAPKALPSPCTACCG